MYRKYTFNKYLSLFHGFLFLVFAIDMCSCQEERGMFFLLNTKYLYILVSICTSFLISINLFYSCAGAILIFFSFSLFIMELVYTHRRESAVWAPFTRSDHTWPLPPALQPVESWAVTLLPSVCKADWAKIQIAVTVWDPASQEQYIRTAPQSLPLVFISVVIAL